MKLTGVIFAAMLMAGCACHRKVVKRPDAINITCHPNEDCTTLNSGNNIITCKFDELGLCVPQPDGAK